MLGLGSRPASTADREVLGLSILAAAIVAVGYVPIRDRVLRSATGLVYGAREAPDEVVRTFGSRLTRAIPMDELLLQLAESLRKTLALTSAEVYTGMGEVLERAVSVPDLGERSLVVSARERPVVTAAGVSGNAWASVWLPALMEGRGSGQLRVAPISHAGELLGLIVVERAEGANAFSEEDDRVLTELARQTGLAFHNAQLDTALQSSLDELRRQADELRASRARIVASGDAERRRVERDLHDGAQQHLVALAVNLRLARDVLAEDPPAAAEMLDELATAVQDTIQELRELAHGIYPPLLVDSGLPEALRAVCNRSPLDTELVTDGIGRYDGDVEAAVYFCCLEALQNAGKHAPDAHVTVRVWEDEGGLLFEVRDDGPGFDVRLARRGHGYVNMSDRLGAIGGSVRWESVPGQRHDDHRLGADRRRQSVTKAPASRPDPQPLQRRRAQVLLVDVRRRARGGGVQREVRRVVRRAQEDDGRGVRLEDAARRLDAVHLGHVDVHQHEVRLERRGELDRLCARRRLAHELEALGAPQHRPGRHPEGRLVVDEQHGDGRVHGHRSVPRRPVKNRGWCHPQRGEAIPPSDSDR